ncbi:hypothetical protein IAT40_000826 [Kwoniella sp. CBS 6097]
MAEAPTDREWLDHLPSFDSLAAKNTSTLLRPFSRFTISSFFRSSPSLPQSTLIQPFFDVNATQDDNQEIQPTKQELKRWLLSLRDYTNQLKEAVVYHKIKQGDQQIKEILSRLAEAYLGCVYFLGGAMAESAVEDHTSSSGGMMDATFNGCLREVLRAFFFLRHEINEQDGSTHNLDRHILGSIFPPDQTKYNHLAPLLAYPRNLIASLQYHPTRPLASSKLNSISSASSPVTPSFRMSIPEDEVTQALDLLDIFVEGVERVHSLFGPVGPVQAKNKKQREEDNHRPIRVALEVKVLKCDLLLSMTTKNISLVKSRAAAQYTSSSGETGEFRAANSMEGGTPSGDAKEDDADQKPRLTEKGDLECVKEESVQPRSPLSETFDALRGPRWEDQAEETLVNLLIAAKHLIEEGRAEVLSSEVHAVDWLGEEGIASLKRQDPLDSSRKSKSPSGAPDTSDQESNYDDSDTEDDEDEEESSEDGTSDEVGGASYACPMRTLFRLHDRYEEQRLAVWLYLPANKREKMGFFMRGAEGKVGSAWDGFGLALMMEYDSETLMGYGLGADKLDKWVELAAAKNTKKIRRKGRKAV